MRLHYGCGLSTGEGWFNCDASPTLRLQRLPVLGGLFQKCMPPLFPPDVHYGDIVRGMDIAPDSCDLVFCSHVLEHLALEDLRAALQNTRRYLKPGGTFRLVLPDFERLIAAYQADPRVNAVSEFMTYSHLGRQQRPKGLMGFLRANLGNSQHLWMWDEKGLAQELKDAGFVSIRRCYYGDSDDPAFLAVESADRFVDSLGFDCRK